MKMWQAHRLWAALSGIGIVLVIAFNPSASFFEKLIYILVGVVVVLLVVEYRRRSKRFK